MDLPEVSDVQSRQDFEMRRSHSYRYFDEAFLKNDFGHACDVCDRLWFRKYLKSPTIAHLAVLRTEFVDPNLAEFSVCNTCRRSLNSKKTPPLAKTNGFRYPPKPRGLPALRMAHFTQATIHAKQTTPARGRFYCAETSTWTLRKTNHL